MISVFLNLLRHALCINTISIQRNVHVHLSSRFIPLLLDGMFCICSTCSEVQFKFSSLMCCPNDLSIIESDVFTELNVHLSLHSDVLILASYIQVLQCGCACTRNYYIVFCFIQVHTLYSIMNLKLVILPSPSLESWQYRHMAPCLALLYCLDEMIFHHCIMKYCNCLLVIELKFSCLKNVQLAPFWLAFA